MENKKIQIISKTTMNHIVSKRDALGLYLALEDNDDGTPRIVACDNSDGKAYIEEFKDLPAAVAWLHGEEKDDSSDKVAVSAEKLREVLFRTSEMERIGKDANTPRPVREVNAATAELVRLVLRLLGLDNKEAPQHGE